jgi:hypothetical protein
MYGNVDYKGNVDYMLCIKSDRQVPSLSTEQNRTEQNRTEQNSIAPTILYGTVRYGAVRYLPAVGGEVESVYGEVHVAVDFSAVRGAPKGGER